MKYAIPLHSPNIHVHASKATRRTAYICPLCKASVSLRAGISIAPYFAHLRGMGDPDCENYFYSEHQLSEPEKFFSYDITPKLEIEIQISNFGPPRGWSIFLQLPVNKISEGQIVVSMEGRVQTVDLSGNSLAVRKIILDPQSRPYSIECSPSNGKLANFLGRYFDALSPDLVNTFGPFEFIGREGAFKAKSLKVNCSYALIFNSALSVKIPKDLIIENLMEKGDWAGVMITVPGKVSYETEVWLEDFTKLKFENVNPTLIPIWPPLIQRRTAQSTLALKDESLIFCLSGSRTIRESYSAEISLELDNELKSVQLDFSAGNPKFLHIPIANNKQLNISCSKALAKSNVDFGLEIQEIKYPSVIVEGRAIDGSKVSASLHSHDIYEIFERVRSGRFTLDSIVFPHACTGKIYVGLHGIWCDGEVLSESGATSARKILAKLEILDSDILLDFGALGRVIIEAEKKASVILALDSTLKSSIRAYLSMLPTTPKWPLASKQMTDSELIFVFKKCKPLEKSKSLYTIIEKKISLLTLKSKGKNE